MHRLSKSLEIRSRIASFSKMSLVTCPCLRRKRAEKSQAILEHLMTFRSSISTGKPEQLLSLMYFLGGGFLKSSVWFMHRQPKRTMCGFGLQRSFGRNILELLVYYLMPNKCKKS